MPVTVCSPRHNFSTLGEGVVTLVFMTLFCAVLANKQGELFFFPILCFFSEVGWNALSVHGLGFVWVERT